MSEIQVIQAALERAAKRRRLAQALRGLWYGLLVGGVIALLVSAIYHVRAIPFQWVILAALVPLPLMLIGSIITGWRRPGLNEVARWVDSKRNLKERVSTALEVAADESGGRWRDLVVSDAASHIKELNVKQIMPLRLPKTAIWSLLVLVLVFGLGFVPEYRSKDFLRQKADQQNIKDVGKQLADLTRRELQKRPPALEPTEKALQKVSELGDQLQKQNLTRSEALRDLANAAEKLKQQINEMGKDPDLKRMQQAARASTGKDSQTASGMQKQMESLQKQLGSPTGNPDALDKLQKELQKLQEAAKGMADKNSPGSAEEKQKLSESLSALSREAQQMGMQMPQLDEAISALAANQTDLMLKDLQEATLDLEKMRDMAKSLQQMQQQMDKLGKDLAEQLKNGQPEAAQSTLNKMVDQLKSAKLSDEQLQKIMQDVSKAVDPAGNYGKVADKLKQAGSQMKGGDKPGASQSLADAAKELEKLMQQMGDAQQMMAEMDKLNQASMCIGSGQGWKMCNKPGYNPKGGRPGGGVGTWADEDNGWMYDGQWSDHWDNTGANRPDQDARGHADRGEGELSDALQPTKVKGQFSPGGQMPSITLKGVSIKGTSKVSYQEAATAAQSDAQSALSQDKVPRAYQGAVRDYFDDIKK
jgi:predicted  nucleic acid-binding Zn-ribbon protein/uncharacterized integral membrane protein